MLVNEIGKLFDFFWLIFAPRGFPPLNHGVAPS
jgi:hypothetical protein